METTGFKVNMAHLNKIKMQAEQDIAELQSKFKKWVMSTQPGLESFNCGSIN